MKQMNKGKPFTYIKPAGMPKPDGPYSYAVKVKPGASLVFMSGLASRNPEGTGLIGHETIWGKSQHHPEPTGSYIQTMRIMERLKGVLESAGATFDDVVSAKIILADIRYWDEGVREAFGKHFKQYPSVTTAGLKHLGVGQMVEIELVAAVED